MNDARRMAPRKGNFRPIFTAIWDDREFQSFDVDAKVVFFCLRTSRFGNWPCIYVVYPSMLSEQTGISLDRVERSLAVLREARWIAYDPPILWVIKGLKNDPNFNPKNSKQVAGIEQILRSLPKSRLIAMFCEFYGFQFEGAPAPNDPIEEPIHDPIDDSTDAQKPEAVSLKPETKKDLSRDAGALGNVPAFPLAGVNAERSIEELRNEIGRTVRLFARGRGWKEEGAFNAILANAGMCFRYRYEQLSSLTDREELEAIRNVGLRFQFVGEDGSAGDDKKNPSPRKKEVPSEDSVRLASLLAELILVNNHKARELQDVRRERTVARWSADIDRMFRIDGRDVGEVEAVIRWSQADEFWRSNILSAAKLRAKFDQLLMKAQRRKGDGRGNSGDNGEVREARREQGRRKYAGLQAKAAVFGDDSPDRQR